jgi:hypothetical protein
MVSESFIDADFRRFFGIEKGKKCTKKVQEKKVKFSEARFFFSVSQAGGRRV